MNFLIVGSTPTFLAVLLASVVGSTHCAAMCGGFVAICGASCGAKGSLQYHLGRLFSYLILGIFAGLLGESVNRIASFAKIQHGAMLLTAIFLVASGVMMLAPGSSSRGRAAFGGRWWQARTSGIFGRLLTEIPVKYRSLLLGLLTGLLPCGWLYTFVVTAMASGSVLGGSLVMTAFWLGTVPALSFVGLVAKYFSDSTRQVLPRLAACLLIGAGLFSFYSHLQVHSATLASGSEIATCHH